MAMRYPGGFISSTAPTVNANTAKGVWTLEEAMQYIRAGQWPVPTGNGDPYFQYNTMLLPGQGTNGAQNNTFLDSSTNNFTITRNGNTTQGTFTPFSGANGNWSNYFDGSGDFLTCPNNAAFDFASGDVTLEAWVYLNAISGSQTVVAAFATGGTGFTAWSLTVNASGFLLMDTWVSGTEQFITATNNPVAANQWTHIAYTRASGTSRLFVNGASCSFSGSISQGINSGGNLTSIASSRYSGFEAYLNGYISNCRVVKGTAVYTSAFTPPTAPLTAISGTSLLTCQSNRFIDNSTNAFAITPSGNTAVTPFQPFGAPTVAYSASTIGGSGYFDGTGDYLVTPSSSNLAVGTGDFCVEMWLYTPASAASQNLYTNANSSVGGDTGLGIFLTSTTAVRLASWNTAFLTTGTGVIVGNQWNHIAVCRSGTTASIFVNGTRQATGTVSNNFSSTSAFTIGSAVSPGDYLTGYISSLRTVKGSSVYDPTQTTLTLPTAPLTAVTNTQLLLSGTNAGIIDNAQDNDLETVGNAQISTTQYKWGASSMYFDGAGDYLYSPSTATTRFGSANWTIETWVRPSSIGSRQIILAWNAVSSGYAACAINLCANGKIGLQISESGSGWKYDDTTTGLGYALSANTWYYLAIIRIGQIITVFLDGNAIGTYSLTASTTSLMTNDTRNVVGISPDLSNQPFTGYLQDTRVTNGYARYQYNFTAPTAALPLFYQAAATPSADPYFEYTTLLLPGNGTNGAQNNTFLDSSTNAFTITRNGNTTQGTFTPFSQTGWGNFFDGSGDYLTVASSTDFNIFGGDMTVECWFYSTAASLGSRSEHLFAFVQDATNRESLYFNGTTLTFWTSSGAGNGPRITYANTPQNQWIHVAVTKSGSTFTMYINGVSVGTSTTTQYSTSNQSLQIGTYNNAGTAADSFTGYISNVRVVKGTNVYTTNFIPSTTPLTPVTNTVLLTCQSNRFIDTNTQTTAKTVTPSGDTSVQAFSPFNPTAAYSTSTVGGSGYFDDSGDYLSIPASSSFVATGNFTLECWFYMPAASGYRAVASSYTNGTGSWIIEVQNTSSLRFYYNGVSNSILSSISVVPNAWTHFAAVRNGSTITIYVNGVSGGTATYSGNFGDATLPFLIGYLASPVYTYIGYVSNLRYVVGTAVYTTSFTPPTSPLTAVSGTALLTNFTNGGITDATAKNNLETVGGASISTTVSKFGGSSMYFDGSGDYMDVLAANQLSNFSSGDWTIEAWIYRSTASANHCILNFINSAGTNAGLTFQVSSSNQLVSDNGTVAALAAGTVPSNQWVHIAIARYSGTTTGYINGVAVGTTTQAPSASQYLRIGALGNGGYAYHGYINDLRVTKGIARYTQNFTPPTSAFLTL